MAKPKCKYCDEIIEKDDLYIINTTTSTGKEKKIRLHKQCLNDYNELMEYKNNEIKWFNETYEYLKELLNYTNEQKLPKSIIIRIQDLRNGVIIEKGIGRVVKSKEGYPYDIILDTLLSNADVIRWAIEQKNFTSENNKINYIMAIVDSHINDSYIASQNKQTIEDIKDRDNIIAEEHVIIPIKKEIVQKKNTGISKFLEDDEL
jgi:hypothetical protein